MNQHMCGGMICAPAWRSGSVALRCLTCRGLRDIWNEHFVTWPHDKHLGWPRKILMSLDDCVEPELRLR